MPVYSRSSSQNLVTCVPPIQRVMNAVIVNYDIIIICGFRNEMDQEKAFRDGYSNARWGQSPHNVFPSEAVDIAPYPWDKYKNDTKKFYEMAAYVLEVASVMGVKLKWAGNWKIRRVSKLVDLPHFELA